MSKVELTAIPNVDEARNAAVESVKASIANRAGASVIASGSLSASMNAAPPVPLDFNMIRSNEQIQFPTVEEANEKQLWIELNMGTRPSPGVLVWSVTDQRFKPFYFSTIQQTRSAYDPDKKTQLVDAATGRPKVMGIDQSCDLYKAWMSKGTSATYADRYAQIAGEAFIMQYGSVFTFNRFGNNGQGAYTTQSYLSSAKKAA